MQIDLRALAQRVSQEEAALQTVARQVGRLGAQLASLRNDVAATLTARPQGSQPQQARAQLDKLCGRYDALCNAHEKVRAEAEVRHTELGDLVHVHAAASSTVDDLSADRAALETAQSEWISAVQEEERALAESKRDMLELERQIAQRRRAIDTARRDAESLRAHNAKLARQLDDSRRRIDKVSRERIGADEALAQRQASVAQAERELAHAHAEIDALHVDRDALEPVAARWRAHLQEHDALARRPPPATPRDARGGRADASERADARESSAPVRRHVTPPRTSRADAERPATRGPAPATRARADAEAREHASADEQLREEHGLLLQRELEWREYCRAVGRVPAERAQAGSVGALDTSRQLQRENDRLREVIAELARRAGEAV